MMMICIDFDGVLHSYSSGWQGADVANDPPVPGAIEFLRRLLADPEMEPMIYSSRSRQEGGPACMMAWLIFHGMTAEEVMRLQFPTQKPAAYLTIDDRAICFEGTFPDLDVIRGFKPWNKRPVPKQATIHEGQPCRAFSGVCDPVLGECLRCGAANGQSCLGFPLTTTKGSEP